MSHPLYRVVSVQIMAPYTLRVCFDDNTEKVICFEHVLGGELYRPLRNLEIFNQVRVDPEVHTLVWPNDADFDPATLHDWPDPFYSIDHLGVTQGESLTNDEMDRTIYKT